MFRIKLNNIFSLQKLNDNVMSLIRFSFWKIILIHLAGIDNVEVLLEYSRCII